MSAGACELRSSDEHTRRKECRRFDWFSRRRVSSRQIPRKIAAPSIHHVDTLYFVCGCTDVVGLGAPACDTVLGGGKCITGAYWLVLAALDDESCFCGQRNGARSDRNWSEVLLDT